MPPEDRNKEVFSALSIPAEILMEGVARGIERGLAANPALVDRLADAICARFEILTPEETAAMLGVTARTLATNHVEWGIDKSVAMGPKFPRHFTSQVLDAVRARKVNGNGAKNVTVFHAPPGHERKVS